MKTIVYHRKSIRSLATAGLIGLALFGNAAYAIGDVDYPNRTDVRAQVAKMRDSMAKEGTVTKAQFLKMQGKLFDMASKDGKMTMPQFKAFMEDFKAFGQ